MEKEQKENIKKIIEADKAEISYDETTGNKIVNEFLFQENLGRGAYSKVKKCINKKTNEDDVDVVLALYKHVHAAVGGMTLNIDIESKQLENDV